jgi:hypothetical protein
MKRHVKPVVALSSTAFLIFAALAPKAQAQSTLIESGTSQLADVFGTSTGSEALSVSWFVLQNTDTGIYTYGYMVSNPTGDVLLNSSGSPTTTPESVDYFSIGFDTTQTGAYLSGSSPVGATLINNGINGLGWALPAVGPGGNSGLMAFESSEAPTMGSAEADGENPPGPWSSVPNGQTVPVPGPGGAKTVPEPTTTALLGLALSILPFRLRRK